jgi:hypothetical protein
MTNKKDVKDIIQKEEIHLNNLLEPQDLTDFKGMVDELRDTWTKKQMFRTETEARFSVLQDNRYPTKAAKYWQCVREQSSYLDNLMTLSFDYRRNEAKITWLEKKIDKEEDEYKRTKYEIDLDECRFAKASMEKVAKHRMREIKMWSKLESYGLQYFEKAKTLNEHSSESEKFNILGQLQSLQRIKKSGELESSYKEQEKLTQDDKKKT